MGNSFIIGIWGTFIVVAVMLVAAYWKIFEKAGESGWKALIPFYSDYILLKISWSANVFWIVLIISLAGALLNTFFPPISILLSLGSFVYNCIRMSKLSEAFGLSAGFTIGLIFLSPVFMIILGFNDAQYIRRTNEKASM